MSSESIERLVQVGARRLIGADDSAPRTSAKKVNEELARDHWLTTIRNFLAL